MRHFRVHVPLYIVTKYILSRFPGYPTNTISVHDSFPNAVGRYQTVVFRNSSPCEAALDGSRKRRGEARDSNYLVRHVQLTGERMRKMEKLEAGRLTDATSIFITLTPKSASSNVRTYNYFKT